MKKRDWILVIAPVIIVLLGMVGYIRSEGYETYKALLSSLKLLKVYLDPLPEEPLLEVARWTGIIFLFGLFYTALVAIIEGNILWSKARRADAVAVHGDSIYVEQLIDSLGRRGIHSDHPLAFKARRQVVMFDSDDKSLAFYQKHSQKLKENQEMHLCLDIGNHIGVEQNNIYVFNIAEVKAISYWKDHYCSGPETITVIGDGKLAEAVLYWGLLTNVFDLTSGIKYQVFGDYSRFIALHRDIAHMIEQYGGDSIEFIKDPWYENIDQIKEADRIILCDDTCDNVETANLLCGAGDFTNIHLFTDISNVETLIDANRCQIVGEISKENIEKILLMDDIHTAGKMCHAVYMLSEKEDRGHALTYEDVSSYIGREEFYDGYTKEFDQDGVTSSYKVGGWNETDAFTRGSNYAAAIHDPLKEKLLAGQGLHAAGMNAEENMAAYHKLDQAVRDRLQEIEHIRWCRYHFLNSWKAPDGDIIVDGKKKAKDAARRLHSCLVPYTDLSEKNKEKDAYFYETLGLRLEKE